MRRFALVISCGLVVVLSPPSVWAKADLGPMQRVQRLWKRVDRAYGLDGQPLPANLHFGKVPVKNADAATTMPAPGQRDIYFGRRLSKRLVSRKPWVRKDARYKALWEFGRATRSDDEFRKMSADPNYGLGWLRHKTNKVSRQLNKQQAQNHRAYLKQRAKR